MVCEQTMRLANSVWPPTAWARVPLLTTYFMLIWGATVLIAGNTR